MNNKTGCPRIFGSMKKQKKPKSFAAGKILKVLVVAALVAGGGGDIDSTTNSTKTNPAYPRDCRSGEFGCEPQRSEQSRDKTKAVESERSERGRTHVAPRSWSQNGSTSVATGCGEGIAALALIVLLKYLRKNRAIYSGKKGEVIKAKINKLLRLLQFLTASSQRDRWLLTIGGRRSLGASGF